ncbi:PREDICTED: uncharacterized protein LOC104536729 [Mesitornis unicolor]|uniref:uncharacterized protein LOC104536729 n=1 Tax=Mesitornis unicolor TaxID=54374 RepID=UPI0005294FAB|nr:PREDICTED: uncharacterized protein LOC104536729 [Mesitornis unicolor]
MSALWWAAGNTGTLRCTYSSNASYIYMAWYRQRPGGPLQYLLQSKGRGGSYSHKAPFARKRFSCQADKSSGMMTITGLKLEDSALYYCTLQRPHTDSLRQGAEPGQRRRRAESCGPGTVAWVWAQLRLVETGGGLRAPGDSVLLSCRGSGFAFGSYRIWWYRQAPGGRPEWVSFLSYSESTKQYGAAVEGRAEVSRDNSRSESSLFLRALRPSDSARYFCAILTGVQTEASGPKVGKVSESLVLSCRISGVPISDSSYAWDWIRQTPGRELQHIVLQYPFTGLQHIAPSFQTQVTSSADMSRNQLSLEVLSPAAADTATYFCSTRKLAKGTVLETLKPPVKPPLPPATPLRMPVLDSFPKEPCWSNCEKRAVTGQVALEQHTRELAVRDGHGVTFQCSMSGDNMGKYYMYWYRQGPRGTLDWIYREGDIYGEGFEGRFKGSVESSQNRITLQIQAANQGDEAVYYCGARLTLEQLCSRLDKKTTDREYQLLSISL